MREDELLRTYEGLPAKQRKVLEGLLRGDSREKIMLDVGISEDALAQHKRQLYKKFNIQILQNEADDSRSGERKLPQLIALFARIKPELINRNTSYFSSPSVSDREIGSNKLIEYCHAAIEIIRAGFIRDSKNLDDKTLKDLTILRRNLQIQNKDTASLDNDIFRYYQETYQESKDRLDQYEERTSEVAIYSNLSIPDREELNSIQAATRLATEETASAFVRLGFKAFSKGSFELAELLLYEAINRDSVHYPDAYFNIGIILQKQGNLKMAVEYFVKALERYELLGLRVEAQSLKELIKELEEL